MILFLNSSESAAPQISTNSSITEETWAFFETTITPVQSRLRINSAKWNGIVRRNPVFIRGKGKNNFVFQLFQTGVTGVLKIDLRDTPFYAFDNIVVEVGVGLKKAILI